MLQKGTLSPPFSKLPPQGALPNFKVFCPNAREQATHIHRHPSRRPCSHSEQLRIISQEVAALKAREASQLQKLVAVSEQVQENDDLIETLRREVALAAASQAFMTEFRQSLPGEFKYVKEPFSLAAAEPSGYCLEGP